MMVACWLFVARVHHHTLLILLPCKEQLCRILKQLKRILYMFS